MNRAGRIAFVCPRFAAGSTVGGAETLLKKLATCAAQDGREVHFLTTCASDHFSWDNARDPGIEEHDGFKVHFFEVDQDRDLETFFAIQERISKRLDVTPEEEHLWLNHNVNSRGLIQHLETEGKGYDCILMGPYLFGLIYHAARVHPDRTYLIPCLHDEAFAYLSVFKDMFRSAAGHLFNARPEQELAERLYGELPPSSVVGMGIDPFEANDGLARSQLGPGDYVIYSGRREPLKGTPLLLDYLDTFRARSGRDLRLVLTGSGDIHPPETLKDAVIDLGFVSEELKRSAMAGASAFIHPSTNESFSIVLLEAWMAGTPALVNGRSDVMRYQCERSNAGLWFRNYPEFEEALSVLLDHNELRNGMADNGSRFVRETYGWSEISRRFFEAIDG